MPGEQIGDTDRNARRDARATMAADTQGSMAFPGVSAMPIMA
jgi:hypothetical protein